MATWIHGIPVYSSANIWEKVSWLSWQYQTKILKIRCLMKRNLDYRSQHPISPSQHRNLKTIKKKHFSNPKRIIKEYDFHWKEAYKAFWRDFLFQPKSKYKHEALHLSHHNNQGVKYLTKRLTSDLFLWYAHKFPLVF